VCCPGSARRRRSPVYGDEIVEFGERWLLRTGLLKAGRMAWNEQAHHLIPLQLRLRPVVQAAARVGFDMNAPLNGIGLPRWRVLQIPLDLDGAGRLVVTSTLEIVEGIHANHPAANFWVLKRLAEIARASARRGRSTRRSRASRSRS
jgi:hypothetical protein